MLTDRQIAQMRHTQSDLMGDTCQIGVFSAGNADAHGTIRGTYTYGSVLSCGFEWRGQSEQHTQIMSTFNADAVLRVPVTSSVASRDRVKVTHRYGEDITDLTFEVIGVGMRGPTATLVFLKQVTT
jgi:hypothetical protein